MPGKHLYEYAVIRVLPVLQREEFLNVGIVLFSKRADLIRVHLAMDEGKLAAFCADLDIDQVRANLEAFERIALGIATGGPIARLDVPSRFRWLTAVRSSAIQTSRPHPGTCDDLERTARRLFEELVL
jgi:hypothetical protein